jgi:hypothetical protein
MWPWGIIWAASRCLAQGGSPAGVTRYLPYGAIRLETGLFPTDRRFTGQRWEASLGLV